MTINPDFKGTMLNISETMQDRHIVITHHL